MRSVLVLMGDTHCGLKNGLLAPNTELDYSGEKVTPNLLAWSDWLWNEVYLPGIMTVGEMAGSDPVFVSHAGDVVHGSRFLEHQYSTWPEHQVQIAVKVMAEWRKLPTLAGFVMAHGTGAHDFGENSATRKVSEYMAAWGLPLVVDDHIDLVLPDNFLVDVAHHGPNAGLRPYTKGNNARNYARDRVSEYLSRGQRAPDLFHRGHVHQDVYEPIVPVQWAGGYRETGIFVTPALCGPNGYAVQASRSIDRAVCGMFFVEILNGKIGTVYPHLVERTTKRVYDMQNYYQWYKGNGVG